LNQKEGIIFGNEKELAMGAKISVRRLYSSDDSFFRSTKCFSARIRSLMDSSNPTVFVNLNHFRIGAVVVEISAFKVDPGSYKSH
jgi:hypothetical protein